MTAPRKFGESDLTLFEYIAVAFSIVLSLGAVSLLSALRRVFAPDRRYWVHAVWVATVLFFHAVVWWSLWSYSVVKAWTLPTFFFVLLQPALLYVQASLLVGDEPATTKSWHAHFFRIRRWFFVVRILYVFVAITASLQILGVPLLHPSRLFGASHVVISLVGISTTSERTHHVLAILAALVTLASALVLYPTPIRWGAV